MEKRIFATIAAIATGAVVLGTSEQATAAEPDSGAPPVAYLVDRDAAECATVIAPGAVSPAAAVGSGSCAVHESSGQGWYLGTDGRVLAAGSGRYLEIPRQVPSVGDELSVGIFDGEGRQEWMYDIDSGQLAPNGHTDLAVTAGKSLRLQKWAGEDGQRWDFAETLPESPAKTVVESPRAETSPIPSAETLPVTGTPVTWVAVSGLAAAGTAAVVLVAYRGRRRMLRGIGDW